MPATPDVIVIVNDSIPLAGWGYLYFLMNFGKKSQIKPTQLSWQNQPKTIVTAV